MGVRQGREREPTEARAGEISRFQHRDRQILGRVGIGSQVQEDPLPDFLAGLDPYVDTGQSAVASDERLAY